jgi:metal-sulfur cluster biosynthetic enzyme
MAIIQQRALMPFIFRMTPASRHCYLTDAGGDQVIMACDAFACASVEVVLPQQWTVHCVFVSAFRRALFSGHQYKGIGDTIVQ